MSRKLLPYISFPILTRHQTADTKQKAEVTLWANTGAEGGGEQILGQQALRNVHVFGVQSKYSGKKNINVVSHFRFNSLIVK